MRMGCAGRPCCAAATQVGTQSDWARANGFPVSDATEKGCNHESIIVAKGGIVTRGILMDIAALKGVEYLEPGTPIYLEDLNAWEKKAGVKVGPGDVIFIHTGRWKRREEKGPSRGYSGLHASCAKWLHDRGVAILGSDDAQDVIPSQVPGVGLPIHQLALVAMGLYSWTIATWSSWRRKRPSANAGSSC
jgi:hypothetical protein